MSYLRSQGWLLTVVIAMVFGSAWPVWGFECPVRQARGVQDVIPESQQDISRLSALLGSADLENDVDVIAQNLKQKYPKASRTEMTDYMVTAYCPVIASDKDLGDAEKRQRLEEFSDQVWQIFSDRGP